MEGSSDSVANTERVLSVYSTRYSFLNSVLVESLTTKKDANKAMEDQNNQSETQNCQDTSNSSSSRKQNQNETPGSKEHEVNQFRFLAGNLALFF